MNSDVVLLLGRKDEPTDAVEEYCQYLSEALRNRSVKAEIVRVPWNARGWVSSLKELRREAAELRGRWIVLEGSAPSICYGERSSCRSCGEYCAHLPCRCSPFRWGRFRGFGRREMRFLFL